MLLVFRDEKYFLTCVDKFSTFSVVQAILSRVIVVNKALILQLINMFSKTKRI